MVLLRERVVNRHGFQSVSTIVYGDGNVDPAPETMLLHGLSNLILQLGQRAWCSDGYFLSRPSRPIVFSSAASPKQRSIAYASS